MNPAPPDIESSPCKLAYKINPPDITRVKKKGLNNNGSVIREMIIKIKNQNRFSKKKLLIVQQKKK